MLGINQNTKMKCLTILRRMLRDHSVISWAAVYVAVSFFSKITFMFSFRLVYFSYGAVPNLTDYLYKDVFSGDSYHIKVSVDEKILNSE